MFKNLTTKQRISYIAMALLLIAALCLPIFTRNSYRMYFFSMVGVYIIAATGLDILLGMSGQISMGHVAYLAVGGYVSVLLSNNLGLPVILTMLIGAFAAAGVGALVAIPCAKLKMQFLVLASIAFAHFVYQGILQLDFLNPYRGLQTKPITLFGLNLNSDYVYTYYFSIFLVVVVLVLRSLLTKSKVGRALMAVRDNTRSADGMGINVRAYKILAFAISAFLCGFAGAYLSHLSGYIISDGFKQPLSFNYLIMVIFGGVNSLFGPVIGAAIYQYINELLASAAAWRSVAYGAVVLIIVGFVPGGCVSALHALRDKLAAVIDGKKGKEAAKQ